MHNNKNEKCSSNNHETKEAIAFCEQCKIYMCKKCNQFHSELFSNHLKYNLNEFKEDIFINLCREKNHSNKLDYYCKTHNKLCCASCITKIRNRDNGQHRDCEVYDLEDIKEEKKNMLKDNIIFLENLSNNIDKSINDIKNLYENINQKKEDLKLKIQKIFTEIRNKINEREDYLLLEVDKQFGELYINENIIKEGEKTPNKIKNLLKKCKLTDKSWKKNNLNSLINDCIVIENDIKNIQDINKNIQILESNINIEIKFKPENSEISKYIEIFNKFGEIYKENRVYYMLNPKTQIKSFKNANNNNMVKQNKNYLINNNKKNLNNYDNNINVKYNNEKYNKQKINFVPNNNYNRNVNYIPNFNDEVNYNRKNYNKNINYIQNNNINYNQNYNIINNMNSNPNIPQQKIINNKFNYNQKENINNNNKNTQRNFINIDNRNKGNLSCNRNRFRIDKSISLDNSLNLMPIKSNNWSEEKAKRSNTEIKFKLNGNNEDKYKSQISLLKDMGFNDEKIILNILKECKGDVERTIEKLLSLN